MANALALFDPASVPDHVKKFLETHDSNIPVSDSIPTLSIKGKVFSISIGGETTKIMKLNSEGEEEPVSILPVVILRSAERRGRNFFEGAYDSDKKSSPICWSNDGVKPDESIPKPKASACNKCPLSQKNSRITENGKGAVACQEFRTIAVVPAHDLAFEPLRVKLPVTSDFDGQNKEAQAKGWYGFKNYLDLLRSKGVTNTNVLSTKLKFDPSAEYPKLQFSPGKWLGDEQLATVEELVESQKVKDLLVISYTPHTEDDKSDLPVDDDEDAAPVVTKPGKAKVAAAVAEDDEDEAAAAAAAAAAKAKAKAAKAKAAAAVEDDEDEAPVVAKTKAPAAAPAKAPKAAVVEDDDDDEAVAAAIRAKKAKAAAATPAKAPAKAAKPVVEEDEDEAPVASAKAPKAAPKAGAAKVSPAVAAVLENWSGEDDDE